MITPPHQPVQALLIHCVEADDYHLENQPDLVWFHVLRAFDWVPFQHIAALYYEALWQFNDDQATTRNRDQPTPNPETKDQATQRLLFERPTLRDDAPVLVENPRPRDPRFVDDPNKLRPGKVPRRLAGRAPKCFFAMFKAFLGLAVRGKIPEPELVHDELESNPAFARACGFTLHDPQVGYRQSDGPSLRKLEQFDQIMAAQGLWAQAAREQVARNLQEGRIHKETTLVHDTTHYPAFSAFRAVELPTTPSAAVPQQPSPSAPSLEAKIFVGTPLRLTAAERQRRQELMASQEAGRLSETDRCELDHIDEIGRLRRQTPAAPPAAADASGQLPPPTASPASNAPSKNRRKSQPRTTKACQCSDRDHCPHPWTNADDGAGTVVKSTGKKYWAHKASTLVFPDANVLLDAVALTDAATHDSQSLSPHLDRLFRQHPQLWGKIGCVLDDGAADDATLKEEVCQRFGIKLFTPINPRRRQPITKHLPRGVDHITNTGTPVCRAGFPFDFVGCRHETGHFLFRAPSDSQGRPVCNGCHLRPECCRRSEGARHITVAFERLPWIDPHFPQLSHRFRKTIAYRTAIERMHKLMKYDYGDEQLTKRGNPAFQARLDKTLLAMHLIIAQT